MVSQAQNSILDNYIIEGTENNLALQQEDIEISRSLLSLKEAKTLFYPQVSFNATYTLAAGGRTIDIPVGDLLNPVYSTLNQVTQTNNFPTIPNVSEQFLPNNFHETYFRVIQPLLNTNIRYNYKAQEALVKLQEIKKEVYATELKKEIKVGYFTYLQTLEALSIYEQTLDLLKEVKRVNEKLVKNDKATPEVIYSAEYEIAKIEQEISNAEKNRQLSQAYFNFLLNKSLDSEIQVDSTLLQQTIDSLQNLTDLQNQALNQRIEFQQLEQATVASNLQIDLYDARKYPEINLIADAGFQGFEYKFNNEQDYVFMQVALRWDLYKGKQNKVKLQQSRIEVDKISLQIEQVKQQIQLQVQQAYYELEASVQAIETAQKALRSSQQNFYLTNKKYEQGQALFIEVLDTQTKYLNAQISLSIAKYDYLIKKANLEYAIGQN